MFDDMLHFVDVRVGSVSSHFVLRKCVFFSGNLVTILEMQEYFEDFVGFSNNQRTLRIFFVVEDEHELTVDVMRLGSMKGAVKVRYYTDAWWRIFDVDRMKSWQGGKMFTLLLNVKIHFCIIYFCMFTFVDIMSKNYTYINIIILCQKALLRTLTPSGQYPPKGPA